MKVKPATLSAGHGRITAIPSCQEPLPVSTRQSAGQSSQSQIQWQMESQEKGVVQPVMKSLNLMKVMMTMSLLKILFPRLTICPLRTSHYPVLPWACINLLSVLMKNPPNVDLQCLLHYPFPPPFPSILVFQAPPIVYLPLLIHQLFPSLHILTLSWINFPHLLHTIHLQFSDSRHQPRPIWQLLPPMTGSRLHRQNFPLQVLQWITQPCQPPVK